MTREMEVLKAAEVLIEKIKALYSETHQVSLAFNDEDGVYWLNVRAQNGDEKLMDGSVRKEYL